MILMRVINVDSGDAAGVGAYCHSARCTRPGGRREKAIVGWPGGHLHEITRPPNTSQIMKKR